MLSPTLYTFLFVMALPTCLAGTGELEGLMGKMEKDVIDLAREVERLYNSRCDIVLYNCHRNNYEHCLSTFPNPTCTASDDFIIEACKGCGAHFDYTVSTVHLPKGVEDGENGNPMDVQVIESICYSRLLDEWFKEKHKNNTSYWAEYGAEPPQMFFGARDGSFRIFPGRRWANCSDYDPRERPWYIAASSGPKNIILVLDTSGSMEDDVLALLKEAATRVIKTLTVRDRIAIVRFSGNATSIPGLNERMLIANKTNKELLINEINKFEAGGGTNFYDAFDAAFAVMERTIEDELNVDRNSAILFLTDGNMTEPKNLTESEVISHVSMRLNETAAISGKPVLLFTFSLSTDEEVHRFPKTLACSTEFGVWSKITDPNLIIESLESYYKLFALGLGQGSNADFVAWVEPYNFTTGGVLGTTVSMPVYDRSTVPPTFLGVVGGDFTLAAMGKVLGLEEAGSHEALDWAILNSKAKCPSLNLSICEMESFRHQGAAGDEALCTAKCSENEFITIEPAKCPSPSDYPDELWNNIDSKGKDYEDEVCCSTNETETAPLCRASGEASNNPSDEASTNPPAAASSNMSGKVFLIAGVCGAFFLVVIISVWWMIYRPGVDLCRRRPKPFVVLPPHPLYVLPLPPPRNPAVTAPSEEDVITM